MKRFCLIAGIMISLAIVSCDEPLDDGTLADGAADDYYYYSAYTNHFLPSGGLRAIADEINDYLKEARKVATKHWINADFSGWPMQEPAWPPDPSVVQPMAYSAEIWLDTYIDATNYSVETFSRNNGVYNDCTNKHVIFCGSYEGNWVDDEFVACEDGVRCGQHVYWDNDNPEHLNVMLIYYDDIVYDIALNDEERITPQDRNIYVKKKVYGVAYHEIFHAYIDDSHCTDPWCIMQVSCDENKWTPFFTAKFPTLCEDHNNDFIAYKRKTETGFCSK